MEITARVSNRTGEHDVWVATSGAERSIAVPPKAEGGGSAVNGGELLLLALATCYCNDVYREAAAQRLRIDRVEVSVRGELRGSRFLRAAAALAVLTAVPPAAAQEPSPYAGLETREIKALSAEQIERYRSGEGMGLAMAAELNDYPGPKHVLELAAELELTEEQTEAVQAAYDAMHAEAVRLGEEIVERERRLDAMFAEATVTEESLRRALDEIGRLEAELRGVHLAAHLETRRLLEPVQVGRYSELRGYAGGGPSHGGGHGHDHGHGGHGGHGGR